MTTATRFRVSDAELALSFRITVGRYWLFHQEARARRDKAIERHGAISRQADWARQDCSTVVESLQALLAVWRSARGLRQ